MNPVIFVPSTISTIRHERKMLVHNKAGIFRFQKELAIYTCRAVAIMATAPRAERLMVDSGKGKSPFCLPALNVNHHAHRNHNATRGENPAGDPPAFANPIHRTGTKTPCPARTVANPAGLRFAGDSSRKTSIILSDSVF